MQQPINYDNLALALTEHIISQRTVTEGLLDGSIDGGKLAQALHDQEVRVRMPTIYIRTHREMPQLETVAVVELTKALKREMSRYKLTYHLWKGHIVIDPEHFSKSPYRAMDAAASSTHPGLRQLCSLDYNVGIRQMQLAESRS